MSSNSASAAFDLAPLAARTFTAVIAAQVARQPERPAVRDPERALSYGALYEEALRVAGGSLRSASADATRCC
jgi:acyl-CoA synthetase (AMP-forming)/AMP-acid ligase II